MIQPALKDEALLADIASARRAPECLHIWWLGQSGFLVQYQGKQLLFDPYLSDSLTRKYASTDKPHVRISERVIHPSQLTGINVVTSTHNHTDHLDAETLQPLLDSNPSMHLVIPEANREFVAQRLGTPHDWPKGLTAGESITLDSFHIQAVPAAHEALDTDPLGRHLYLGFLVRVGPWSIYHSGDTVRYPGMEKALQDADLDLALLPINGRLPKRRVAGNLWGREAAQLAHDIHARTTIPCHYDLFEFNTASPEDFIQECRTLNAPYQVLQLGKRFSLSPSPSCP